MKRTQNPQRSMATPPGFRFFSPRLPVNLPFLWLGPVDHLISAAKSNFWCLFCQAIQKKHQRSFGYASCFFAQPSANTPKTYFSRDEIEWSTDPKGIIPQIMERLI